MKNRFFLRTSFLCFPLLFGILSSCHDPTAPVNELKPGRRDYVWTTDTFKVSQGTLLTITRMWGSSINDIWAVGYADMTTLTVWHYDGKQWTNVKTGNKSGPRSIWGTAGNNIWVGTQIGSFWHYDGSSWKEFGKLELPGYNLIVIECLEGNGPNDIYGCGTAFKPNDEHIGVLVHFDGIKWKFVDIAPRSEYFMQIRKNSDGYFYITSHNNDSSIYIDRHYRLESNALREMYRGQERVTQTKVGSEICFQIGPNTYRLRGNDLIEWERFDRYAFIGMFGGRNERDYFYLEGYYIKHFNGFDHCAMFPTMATFNLPCIFEKEIIFVGKDFETGINFTIKGVLPSD